MKVIGDKYHLFIDEEANWKMKMGDTEIFFDPEYNLELNTIQVGEVLEYPNKFNHTENQFGRLADKGERVYFHHLVHSKDNFVDLSEDVKERKGFYIADPLQIFCSVVDDEIHMLNDFVLVKPIEEKDKTTASGIVVETAKTAFVPNVGIVHHVREHGPSYGVNPGDKIFFTDNSEYEIEIEGEKYYCMQLHRDIPYVIESDGAITMLGMWGVVEALDEGDEFEENDFGVFMQRRNRVQKHKGRVAYLSNREKWEVEVDDEVIFDRKGHFQTTIDNKDYYCLNIKRDILLLFCV